MRAYQSWPLCLSLFSVVLELTSACPPDGSFMVLQDGSIRGPRGDWLPAENSTKLAKHELRRRWIHMIPPAQTPNVGQNQNHFGETWDGNTIPYCFGSAVSLDEQTILRRDLKAAWKSWISAGINSRVINFREGTPSECIPSRRGDYLEVLTHATQLVTTLGNNGASTITLTTNGDLGFGDRVANYAHEIGHAFGLLHEQQRNDLWTSDYGGTASTNTFNFICENLADYDAKLGPMAPKDRTATCRSHNLAAGVAGGGFSATEFLPFSGYVKMGGPFDRKSIMLYTSKMGGKTVGNVKQTVYTLANGELFTASGSPSAGDVQNLNDLYPAATPQATPCLFFQDCSPFQTVFRSVTGCFTTSH